MTAEPERVAAWRQRLSSISGLRIGLVWSGNTAAIYNPRRSPGLNQLRPMIDCPGVTAFALQMGGGRADLEGRATAAVFRRSRA